MPPQQKSHRGVILVPEQRLGDWDTALLSVIQLVNGLGRTVWMSCSIINGLTKEISWIS